LVTVLQPFLGFATEGGGEGGRKGRQGGGEGSVKVEGRKVGGKREEKGKGREGGGEGGGISVHNALLAVRM